MSDDQVLEGTWAKLSEVAVKGAQYNSRERQPHPKCLEGTRVNLLKCIHGFLDDTEKNQLVWLHGTAGVGKSAVAFTVAEKMRDLKVTKDTNVEKRLAGTFFFSRKHTKRCTAGNFFATLVYQLVTNFPSIRKDVCRTIRDNPALLDPDAPLCDQMEAFFLRPLRKLQSRLCGCPPLSFVIDALDECTSEPEVKDLMLSLARALRDPDLPVTHILLTSRSETYISKVFQNDEVRPLVREIPVRTSVEGGILSESLDGADVDNDICTFLRHSFEELGCRHPHFPQPSEVDLRKLAGRAGRRFIVASTMMKFIIDDEDKDPRDRLQLMLELTSKLLQGTEVYKLYDCILSTCADPKRAYMHLSIVAALADPLPISQISTLLGPGLGRDVQTTLIQLRSLMDIPTDSTLPVNIYHSSIRDYISYPSNCELPQVRKNDMPSPHFLLADSSLRLMMKEIAESTALLDALSELKKQSNAMQPEDPHRLKDSLAFLVRPPEPLSAVICMMWLRGDHTSDLQSWLETVDGHAWLQTQAGQDWLQTQAGRNWLQAQAGQDWVQTRGGRDWVQTEGGRDWLHTVGGREWLQTRGRDWMQIQAGRDWLQTEGGEEWLQTEGGEEWLQTWGGREWLQIEEGRDWLQTDGGKDWLQTEGGEEWLQTEGGEEWLQTRRGQHWLQTRGGRHWLHWLLIRTRRDWLLLIEDRMRIQGEQEWLLQIEGEQEWLMRIQEQELPLQTKEEREQLLRIHEEREQLQIQGGRDWLQIEEGRDWLQTDGGKDWLQTEGGEEWLQTEGGEEWLQTWGGREWLQTEGGREWLQTQTGREWLQTQAGRHWLQTEQGRDWLQPWGGRDWLQTEGGQDWLQTEGGKDWLQTEGGKDWLQAWGGRVWLQTKGGRVWLQTKGGRVWLHTEGRHWLQTEGGRAWLQTKGGRHWPQTEEGRVWVQTDGGREWLKTKEGGRWLQTWGGRVWLQTEEGPDWLQTEGGRDWLQTQMGRDWLQTQTGRDWLRDQTGQDWLQTKGGRDWLQTGGGEDWLQTEGEDWLQTQGVREWLQTKGGRDWLQTKGGREWLQTQTGRHWLQTPHGQVWQSTPAASVWVTIEEFVRASEAINEYIVISDVPLPPAFQVIQQFKTLPDFLMFPVFLALRHRHNSTSALPESPLPPDREIIHAMNTFQRFANEAQERSQSASDALKYACHNWAVHLSRAPHPWDGALNHIFQAFWNHHIIPWLEMEWCLKGLRSCLVVLSEGQKRPPWHQ